MTRFLLVVTALGVLAIAPQASAACRWFGTQLDCALGGEARLVIGTQEAAEPSYVRVVRPPGFNGGARFLDSRAMPEWPLTLDLQDIGTNPDLCRKWGNETYCD